MRRFDENAPTIIKYGKTVSFPTTKNGVAIQVKRDDRPARSCNFSRHLGLALFSNDSESEMK